MSIVEQMIDRHVLAVPRLSDEMNIDGSVGVVCCAVVIVGRRVSFCDRGAPPSESAATAVFHKHTHVHTHAHAH
jgi:hypothetical protein